MSNKRIIELVNRIVVEEDFETLSDLNAELRKLLADEIAEFKAKRELVRVVRA